MKPWETRPWESNSHGFTGSGLFFNDAGEMVVGLVENGRVKTVENFSVSPAEAAKANLAAVLSDFHRLARDLESGTMELSKIDSGILPKEVGKTPMTPAALADSNVITSRINGGGSPRHRVAIDLDMDAALIPSSTKGHHHLIIDKYLSWERYQKLLEALKIAGLIGPGFYQASVNREATVLRTPWTKK